MAEGNGGAAPQLEALAQYVKDLSFENPNAPRSLGPQETPPNISIQVNVNAKPLAEGEYEIELILEGKAGEGEGLLFSFELNFRRRVPAGEYSGKSCPSGTDDRVPAPDVPVCPRGSRKCGARRRLPALPAATDRFRTALSGAHGRNGPAEHEQLTLLAFEFDPSNSRATLA
jgi:hypothetical protein